MGSSTSRVTNTGETGYLDGLSELLQSVHADVTIDPTEFITPPPPPPVSSSISVKNEVCLLPPPPSFHWDDTKRWFEQKLEL